VLNRRELPEISEQTKRSWRPIRHEHSAGGVAYRFNPDTNQIEIALIATRGGMRWQLPKGALEEREASLEAAIREVYEEVGLCTEAECFLKSIDYWYWDTYRKSVPELVHKAVDFYLLRTVGGTLSDQCYEVDAVAWYPPEQALEILTFAGETEVVRLALARLDQRS
jgi:8-oxo-dGTP pyrophosphatase MutT (NUDIX family)